MYKAALKHKGIYAASPVIRHLMYSSWFNLICCHWHFTPYQPKAIVWGWGYSGALLSAWPAAGQFHTVMLWKWHRLDVIMTHSWDWRSQGAHVAPQWLFPQQPVMGMGVSGATKVLTRGRPIMIFQRRYRLLEDSKKPIPIKSDNFFI